MNSPEPDPEQPDPASSWPPPPPPAPPAYPYSPYPPPYSPPPYPQPVYSVPSPLPERPVTNTGPAGFAFGVLSVLLGWIPVVGVVGIACGVVGIVLSMKALRLAKLGYISDRGLAIAGVVCACTGLALGGAINLFVLISLLVV